MFPLLEVERNELAQFKGKTFRLMKALTSYMLSLRVVIEDCSYGFRDLKFYISHVPSNLITQTGISIIRVPLVGII